MNKRENARAIIIKDNELLTQFLEGKRLKKEQKNIMLFPVVE